MLSDIHGWAKIIPTQSCRAIQMNNGPRHLAMHRDVVERAEQPMEDFQNLPEHPAAGLLFSGVEQAGEEIAAVAQLL
jgi:hypothetical protein